MDGISPGSLERVFGPPNVITRVPPRGPDDENWIVAAWPEGPVGDLSGDLLSNMW